MIMTCYGSEGCEFKTLELQSLGCIDTGIQGLMREGGGKPEINMNANPQLNCNMVVFKSIDDKRLDPSHVQ